MPQECILILGVNTMTENEKILTNIIRTTLFGQTGINAVMPKTEQPALRQALRVQRLEYQSIGAKAKNLAKEKGLKAKTSPAMMQRMSAMGTTGRLVFGKDDSKIAGMMIQGNTRGMIQSLKRMHRSKHVDEDVAQLAQALLDTEVNNIKSMEGFL